MRPSHVQAINVTAGQQIVLNPPSQLLGGTLELLIDGIMGNGKADLKFLHASNELLLHIIFDPTEGSLSMTNRWLVHHAYQCSLCSL